MAAPVAARPGRRAPVAATPRLAAPLPGPRPAAAVEQEDGGLRSVSIAVSVLDCFRGSTELGPTRVATELGIAKSTASRMLAALATGGMLERADGGRYRLSLRLFEYGQLAVDRLPLRAVARSVLLELHESLHEMVQLGLPVGGHVVYVERVGSAGGARLSGEVLRRVPGYSSSAGRVMAAFDPAIARAAAAVARRQHTPFTITDPVRLDRVLRCARTAGWTSAREEFELGFSSVAAPVFAPGPDSASGSDGCGGAGGAGGAVPGPGGARVVGAVSVVGPTAHVAGLRKDFVVASVCRAARRVTGLLARLEET